jgi:hypothetical protein
VGLQQLLAMDLDLRCSFLRTQFLSPDSMAECVRQCLQTMYWAACNPRSDEMN